MRPEHLTARPAGGEGLAAEVRGVERLGADAFAHCAIAGVADPAEAALVVRLPGDAALAPGARITVTLDAAAAHLFDAATGRRLAAR